MKLPTDAEITRVMSALALRRSPEQRKGGRKPIPTQCERCRVLFPSARACHRHKCSSPTARQARVHKCEETR